MGETSDAIRARLIDVGVLAPAPGTFTYRLPDALAPRALPGSRLLVPFGRRRLTGILLGEAARAAGEAGMAVRDVLDVLDDDLPALPPGLLGLLRWVSDYYLHPAGLTLRSALPAALVTSSRKTVALTPEGREAHRAGRGAGDEAAALLAYLARRGRAPERTLLDHFPRAALTALTERGWAAGEDRVERRGAPTRLRWRANLQGASLEEALARIPPRARSQRAALRDLVSTGPIGAEDIRGNGGWSMSALRALRERGLALAERAPRRVDPFTGTPVPRIRPQR